MKIKSSPRGFNFLGNDVICGNRVPKAGDMVNVLIYHATSTEPVWRVGVLLKWPDSIRFDNNLWVEVLVDGMVIKSSPNQIELI